MTGYIGPISLIIPNMNKGFGKHKPSLAEVGHERPHRGARVAMPRGDPATW